MENCLSWSKDELRVRIYDHAPFLDVEARVPDGYVKMMLKYTPSYVFIEDIQGNGFDSKLQGKGTGSLLVNTAVQYLRAKLSADIEVSGEMSDANDPREPDLLKHCQTNRIKFWASFGFTIIPSAVGRDRLIAKLSDLKVKKDGTVLGSHPKYIPLSSFTEDALPHRRL
ncbi:hypothetical protein [Ningiella ruwaisensis]|uniref:hypothetical protein n=1 Tax=Alteromonadaceae TaxID=72275 RepID=UPI0010A097C1|nr:hypothetical protein [Ningiella ruwaisensis]